MAFASRIGRSCLLPALAALLCSCGGGGGGAGGGGAAAASISFSPTSVSFSAATAHSAPPQTQTITGTVTGAASGTLYIKIVENDPDIATATGITVSGDSGQATIVPANPTALLAGTHQGSFTVYACLNDPSCSSGQLNGSPQTISVTYDIGSSVDADTVMPRVVAVNTGGTVILRGHGFTGASAVTFGTTAADSVSVVSDTEIHATYPPLAAGSYDIAIDSGNVAYSATLDVVSPPAFVAAFLTYPVSTPAPATSFSYDADRSALLVVTGSTLLRYAFDGSSWGSPEQVVMSGLQQVSVSPDGTKLLALVVTTNAVNNGMSMVELDPLTLAQTDSTPVTEPSHGAFTGNIGGGFACSNDGTALVWSDIMSSAYAFGTSSRTWTALYDDQGAPVLPEGAFASGDGSEVMLMPYDEYVSSTGIVQKLGILSNSVYSMTSADLTGSEFAGSSVVLGPEGQLLGQVPDAAGMVVNPAGTRLYAVLATDPQPELHMYDLTAAPSNGFYPELGAPITLAGNTGDLGFPQPLAITPDGGTVFIAGPDGIAVQPVSP